MIELELGELPHALLALVVAVAPAVETRFGAVGRLTVIVGRGDVSE
jgi:hypothetical protein